MNKIRKIFKILLVFIKVRWYHKWDNREKLEKYQNKKLKKQLKFFEKNSPFFIKNKFNENIQMNKEFMMNNFDELNTVGIKKEEALKLAFESEEQRTFNKKYKNISVGLSSGTSGHRGLFITTDEEQAIWAGTILAKMLPKKLLQKHRLAFFLRANNELYNSINSYFIKLEYFDTFIEPQKHIEKLNKYKPTILIAPASMLCILAKYKEDGKLKVHPKKIISVAEVLEERDKVYIKKCFLLDIIHEVYQATEGFLGFTCEYGNMHLNEDIIKFERQYIDDKRFYPIISDFERTSQPFINYLLNDILVENNERCECGSILQKIEKIEGRSDDIFIFFNRNGKQVKIFPDFIRRCILFIDDIREYQVYQTSFYDINIAILDIKEEQKNKILIEFEKLLENYNIDKKKIKIDFIDYKINNRIKLKRIYSELKLKNDIFINENF